MPREQHRTVRRNVPSRVATDESTCTPGSVPRVRGGGHPSRPAVAGRLQRPTRGHRTGRPQSPAQVPPFGRYPLGLAPGGVYRATPVTRGAGGLLPHRFTLTRPPTEAGGPGGLFSVALSRGSPRVAVSNHPALWSPDVPRRPLKGGRRDRPVDSSVAQTILRRAGRVRPIRAPARHHLTSAGK